VNFKVILLPQWMSQQFLGCNNSRVGVSIRLWHFDLWRRNHIVFSKQVTHLHDQEVLYQFGWSDAIGHILNDLGTSAFAGVTSTLPPPHFPMTWIQELGHRWHLNSVATCHHAAYFVPYGDMQYAGGGGDLKGYAKKKFCYRSQRCVCGLD
jgi:hypothetical protein